MTTIVWDGKRLTADRQATNGAGRMGIVAKLFEVDQNGDRYLCAGSGDLGRVMYTLRWFEQGANAKKWVEHENDACDFITIDKDGRAFLFHDSPHPFEILDKPAAWGSGAPYALVAMRFGVDARQAIHIASDFDANTGKGIEELVL